MNELIIFKGSTRSIAIEYSITGFTDLTGFESNLIIKSAKGEILTKEADILTLTEIGFDFSITETNLAIGSYRYEVTLTSATVKYVLVQDNLIIKKPLSW